MIMAYADPPYPGMSAKYYRDEPTYAGEVDHPALIASLRTSYDGWALSTSSKALRDVLPMCPPGARVCAWVKPIGVPPATFGPHSVWEPLIVVPGRLLRPGVGDALRAQPARFGGTLPGRKPLAFVAWLFDLLGLLPGDTLDDLFPGTGIVGRAWAELSSRVRSDGSSGDDGDGSRRYLGDTAPEYSGDGSPRVVGDAESSAPGDVFGAAPSDVSPPGLSDLFPRGVNDVSARAPDDGPRDPAASSRVQSDEAMGPGQRVFRASRRVHDDRPVAEDLGDGGAP